MLALSIITVGGVQIAKYYAHQNTQAEVTKTAAYLKDIDEKIAEVREKRIAEQKAKEEAERKAKEAAKKAEAKRKAEAEAALQAQLAGQVVTPSACKISGTHGNPNNIDVVVNKKRCLNPVNFVPSDLVSYSGYLVSNKILAKLTAMISAASAAGESLGLTSTYRSYDNQVSTYNYWVNYHGSTAVADTISARPGYSEHQTGFAVDLSGSGQNLNGFAGTSEYAWMKKNGHKYGFIQRYKSGYESITGYSAEAWHWRYVGVSVATDMKNKGIHTLEQYWGIGGGGY